MAVSEAIRAGRLVKSVIRVNAAGQLDPSGPPKIADPDLADQEWERNTDSQKRSNAAGGVPVTAAPALLAIAQPPRVASPAPPPMEESVASATERLKSAQADLAELKRDAERGELVLASEVEKRLVAVFTACKTRLLAIPSRARQALPHMVNADVATLENLIREALEDLVEAGST